MSRESRIRIGLLLGSCLCTFFAIALFGEAVLRMRGPGLDGVGVRYLYRWHPSAGYALSPGVHHDGRAPFDTGRVHGFRTHTNAFGFRSKETAFEKRGFRIVMLGDSFTFGTGVADEESFSWVLDDLLDAGPGSAGAEILNAGTNGSSNVSQINYFRADGVRFDPDLVVLNVYTGNDFDQNLEDAEGVATCFRYGLYQAYTHPGDWIVRAGYAASADTLAPRFLYVSPCPAQRGDEYLHGASRFYGEVSDRLLSLGSVQRLLLTAGWMRMDTRRRRRINVHQTGSLRVGRRYTEEMLLVFRDYLEGRGMALLVHLIPYRHEIRAAGRPPADPNHRRNTELFCRFLGRNGFPYVSDIPAFERGDVESGDLYGALWGHYTPGQHRAAAAGLYRAIADRYLGIGPTEQERALDAVKAQWSGRLDGPGPSNF